MLAVREARRVLTPDLAEDAAQEALVRAWRNAHACTGAPEPWVRTIAQREALRLLNRSAAFALDETYDAAHAGDQSETVELKLDVAQRLANMSAREREVLFLRHWADKSADEIARILAIPIGTVKVRLHRAHKRLGRDFPSTFPNPRRDRVDNFAHTH